jgi:hypothetical protein
MRAHRESRAGNAPEMDRLGTNGAVPEARKASRASGRRRSSAGISVPGSEERAEAAEDAGAGAEGHDCGVFPVRSSGGSGRRWVEGRGQRAEGQRAEGRGRVSCKSARDTGARVAASGLRRLCG